MTQIKFLKENNKYFQRNSRCLAFCFLAIEISGCKETTTDEKDKNYVRKERMSESFYRRLTLPEEISTRKLALT